VLFEQLSLFGSGQVLGQKEKEKKIENEDRYG